jgi:hypothetical protein
MIWLLSLTLGTLLVLLGLLACYPIPTLVVAVLAGIGISYAVPPVWHLMEAEQARREAVSRAAYAPQQYCVDYAKIPGRDTISLTKWNECRKRQGFQ